MPELWHIARGVTHFGPYTVEQLQTMALSGQLEASDTLVNEETGHETLAHRLPALSLGRKRPSLFAQSFSGAREGTAEEDVPKPERPAAHRGLWVAGFVVLAGVAVAGWRMHRASVPDLDFTHLPECFHSSERIKTRLETPADKTLVWVDNRGWTRKENVPPPGEFTPDWLEATFTHYLARDAFVFETPEMKFPSAAKMSQGEMFVFGAQVGDFSLVCTRTRDNRAINMFVQSDCLRPRSQGPPPLSPESASD